MAGDYASIDITEAPPLPELVEEVRRTKRPRVLRSVNENVAIIAPVKRPVRQGGKRFSEDDPFWEVVGIGQTAEPTNIAEHKDDYLAEAYMPKQG
jgi:hypothetical protein